MSIPTLTPLPPYPSRTAAPETWAALADAFVAAEFNFVNVDMNTQVIPGMNQAVEDVNDGVNASAANVLASQDARDAAEGFANAANTAKSAAELAAGNASTSESNAADSELAASGYASSASTSASNAATSESNAFSSANMAEAWADTPEGVEVEPGRYSAFHWAEKAADLVSSGIIDDTAISPTLVRSSLNDSIGNFQDVPVNTSTSISVMQFARIITETPVSVTLPTNPAAGQMVMVGNLTGRNDHQIVVGSTPVKGQNAGGSIIIDKPFYTLTLKYIGPVYGWEII